jgi:hypothetical protein
VSDLSEEAADLLREAQRHGIANIHAENIVPAAELIRAGLAVARNDMHGPWLDPR